MNSFTVCIVAAGKGTRIGSFCNELNKAFLPVKGRPAISWIFNAYPKGTRFVIAVGYLGNQLKEYIKFGHPELDVTFVDVDNYDGPGCGPGYSLLCCKDKIQEPFIFATVDDMVPTVPPPTENWYGVEEVEDTTPFASVKIDESGKAIQIDDKTKTDNKYAFIGIAGVYDWKAFFDALGGNRELLAGEHQTSNGFKALMKLGMHVRELDWYNTGTPEAYEKTKKTWPKH